jgi:hypothetical protein
MARHEPKIIDEKVAVFEAFMADAASLADLSEALDRFVESGEDVRLVGLVDELLAFHRIHRSGGGSHAMTGVRESRVLAAINLKKDPYTSISV